ncbi:MAG TPA: ABC transporter permease [Puia sp.]|nr:ABC transporter permease [Puia sp.]
MIRNYFTIAIRHLMRHKLFSAINILCLAIGITFTMIIGVYVMNQQDVNQSIKDVRNQYLVKSKWKVKEMGMDITTFGPLAKMAKEEYPTLVENFYRYNPVATVVSVGINHFKENIAIGDTTLVSMYNLPVLYGNKEKAFTNISSAVLTETVAQKLFGTKNAIGKSLIVETVNGAKQEYSISAVLKDIPKNSITGLIGVDYNLFVPTIGNQFYGGGDPAEGWNSPYEVGMIELKKGISPQQMILPFKQILKKYSDKNAQDNLEVELAPLKDYYLKNNNGAVQKMITALSFIAAFILLMAIINFVNINIGTSSYRLKEIGLRKVFGSVRRQLVIQFISEALILTFIAAIISLALYEMLRNLFGELLNTPLISVWHFDAVKIFLFASFLLFIGFISGVYPAFVLSSSNVINAVKGKIDSAKGGLLLRKALLIVQFSLAIIVFISALNVSKQMSYVFHKDLGYNKEQLLLVDAYPKQWDSIGVMRMKNVKQQLLQLREVKDASLSFDIPVRKPPGNITLYPQGQKDNNPLVLAVFSADQDYATTFGLKMAAGSFFNHSGGFIPAQIVINESAAKALGFSNANAAVGRQIQQPTGNPMLTIAGVIKDYHYSSMQQQIEPLVIIHFEDARAYRYMNLKLATDDFPKAVDAVKKKWKELLPDAPFEYVFMDDQFQSLYKSELQLKKATNIATALNLIIVFMGIFGVVAFTLAKRTKEIAVRKVLGADIKDILSLFIKDYAWLILIANLIAWPLAYIITNKWLENYAYRIQQNAIPYFTVCIFIFVTAFILITAQCLKTAVTNPVKSLRAE